jgi:hypothetical protein
MADDDDQMSIEEFREFLEQHPRGRWVEPDEAAPTTIIFVPRAPEAPNASDAQSDRRDE